MGVDVYNVGGNVGEAGCGTGLMVVMVSLLGRCGALVGGQWPPSQQYYLGVFVETYSFHMRGVLGHVFKTDNCIQEGSSSRW